MTLFEPEFERGIPRGGSSGFHITNSFSRGVIRLHPTISLSEMAKGKNLSENEWTGSRLSESIQVYFDSLPRRYLSRTKRPVGDVNTSDGPRAVSLCFKASR